MRSLGTSGPCAALVVLSSVLLSSVGLVSCSGDQPDVVVYTAMDQEHSEQILKLFQERTGLDVRMEFDVEANKTIGLVERLRREAHAPRCDVFWNNEIANTIALAEEGLLEPYDSPSAADIPAEFKDAAHHWTGFALRARCIILNVDEVLRVLPDESSRPDSLEDLLDGPWAAHGSIAKPLTGTTLTHFAVLYQKLGFDAGHDLAVRVRDANARGELDLASGNGPLMRSVGVGATCWGFTDTDDFNVARLRGHPVERIFADQGEGGLGTLVIPNTVAIIKNCKNQANARRLVDFLLSPEVEGLLAEADSAQIPTRRSVARPAHVPDLAELRTMQVDWAAVGRELPRVHEDLKEIFLR